MKKLFFILFALASVSCQQNETKHIENNSEKINSVITIEFNRLNSDTDKNEYLEYIFDIDQGIRSNIFNDLVWIYSKNSKENTYHSLLMNSLDDLNYVRIDRYLTYFGHPTKENFSDKAINAVWAVLHHNTDLHKRKKHLQTLYQAYQGGVLTPDRMDLFLRRTYKKEFGVFPTWEGNYHLEEKIVWMIEKLKPY